MPYKMPFYPNSQKSTYSSGGPIALTLDRIPGTLTELWVGVTVNLSITSASGLLDDIWDRLVASLALQFGQTYYFQFTDLTLAQHDARGIGMAPPRISFPSSASSVAYTFWYRLHFGSLPYIFDPDCGQWVENKWDLSGGIPPLPANSLQLSGSWGSNTALAASGVTINSASLQPYFTYIAPGQGEKDSDYQPMAFPVWVTEDDSNLVTAGYGQFGQTIPLPINDWIQGVMFVTRTGSPLLRSDNVLTSLRLRDTSSNRDVFSALNWTDLTAASQQARTGFDDGQPPSDGTTIGTVAYPPVSSFGSTSVVFSNAGVARLDLRRWISEPDKLYGLNMDPAVNPYSQLVWQVGTNSASSNQLRVLYRKYKKNDQSTATWQSGIKSKATARAPLPTPASGSAVAAAMGH